LCLVTEKLLSQHNLLNNGTRLQVIPYLLRSTAQTAPQENVLTSPDHRIDARWLSVAVQQDMEHFRQT
jgi:hypothetical protein